MPSSCDVLLVTMRGGGKPMLVVDSSVRSWYVVVVDFVVVG